MAITNEPIARIFGRSSAAVLFFLFAGTLCRAQFSFEGSRLDGAVSFGYLDSRAEERQKREISNFFAGLDLRFRSFVIHPDFIDYRIRTRLNTGLQNGLTGTAAGNAIDVGATFLRSRPWPVTVRYFRQSRTILNSLTGPSLVRTFSDADDESFDLGWGYHVASHPRFDVNLNHTTNVVRNPALLLAGSRLKTRSFSVRGQDDRYGWHLDGNVLLSSLQGGVPRGVDGEAELLRSDNDRNLAGVRATRSLSESWRLMLAYDYRRFDTRLADRALSNDYSGVWSQLNYRPRGRFSFSNRLLLSKSHFRSLDGPDARIPDDLSERRVETEARYRISSLFSVRGLNEVSFQDSATGSLRGGLLSRNGAGVDFTYSRGLLSLRTGYTFSGNTNSRLGKDAGRFLGHDLDGQVTMGSPRSLLVGVRASIFRNRNTINRLFAGRNTGERVGFEVSREFAGAWLLRVSADRGWQVSQFPSARTDLRISNYGVSLTRPRLSLTFSRTTTSGDGFSFLLDEIGGPPVDPSVPPVLALLESSAYKGIQAGATFSLARNVNFRAAWYRFQQTAGGTFMSRVERREALLSWRFRRVTLEIGYYFDRYDFSRSAMRQQWVIRIVRDFRLF